MKRCYGKEEPYESMGWHENGRREWTYVYRGGQIGAAGAGKPRLDPALDSYTLDYAGEINGSAAAHTSMRLLEAMDPRIVVPMMGATYLAPLMEFLRRAGTGISFAMMLTGPTGSGKSTAAALFLSHFGDFTATSLPANFQATRNCILNMAVTCKDMPLVVDDYYPAIEKAEQRRMDKAARALLGYMRESEMDLLLCGAEAAMQPTGLPIFTGEAEPEMNGKERCLYTIETHREDLQWEKITELQALARSGYLRQAMRGYIEWLLPRAERLPEMVKRRYSTWRTRAKREDTRRPEAAAALMVGYGMAMDYMEYWGFATGEAKADSLETGWEILKG